MRRLRALFLRLGGFVRKQDWERDMATELESNLQLHIADNMRAGMSPDDARRAAVLDFGAIASAKENYRDRKVSHCSKLWRRIFATPRVRCGKTQGSRWSRS